MDELKKCPFCGGEAARCSDGGTLFLVCCRECKVETNVYKTEKEAIKAWNRRTIDERKEM